MTDGLPDGITTVTVRFEAPVGEISVLNAAIRDMVRRSGGQVIEDSTDGLAIGLLFLDNRSIIRALTAQGITDVDQLAARTEVELMRMPGIKLGAIRTIKRRMADLPVPRTLRGVRVAVADQIELLPLPLGTYLLLRNLNLRSISGVAASDPDGYNFRTYVSLLGVLDQAGHPFARLPDNSEKRREAIEYTLRSLIDITNPKARRLGLRGIPYDDAYAALTTLGLSSRQSEFQLGTLGILRPGEPDDPA